jgi:hypothetical protein
VLYLKADGTFTKAAGQTFTLEVELGTTVNGNFTSRNPVVKSAVTPTVNGNSGTYTHTFLTPLTAGTHAVMTKMTIKTPLIPFGFQTNYLYATSSVIVP